MVSTEVAPRTGNPVVPRRYGRSKRRFTVYWAWSYPWEANRDVTQLDNRYSTWTEVRRVAWPAYESADYSPARFLQGIAGTLELFHLSLEHFRHVVSDVTGHPVVVYQRVDPSGRTTPLDEHVLDDTDTLLVFGLDHMVADQVASADEVRAVRRFVAREGACLVLGPHHDVGASDDLAVRAFEYAHHGDPLVPRQQRFGLFTRSLMTALHVPVENRFGLRPSVERGTTRPTPLRIASDLDRRGWLDRVTTFNFHMHLPHYALTTTDLESIHLLATQPIDVSRPHPFVDAGNDALNALLWMPPEGERGGDILVADSTIFTTLFGGNESLEQFWKNLATR
jgi:hypothetical protein